MGSNRLTLGIVTISYNQAPYLAEAIESVQLRDPDRLRYVIVDPGSTDGSREIIDRYKDRFSAMVLTPDRGPADGLNRGFECCHADVYGFLNADDRFPPGVLDWVLDYFEQNPEVDMIMGALRIIDKAGNRARRQGSTAWKFSSQNFLDRVCAIVQQSTFFRKSAWDKVSGFNINNATCWDSELFVDMDLAGARTHQVLRVLGEFRIYPDSITGSQRLKERTEQDMKAIDQKIMSRGLRPAPWPLNTLKRAAFRLHPVRQTQRFLVG